MAESAGSATADTLLAIHDEFAKSGGHLDNLLDPAFDHMGVGVAEGADGRVWVVEVFADL